MEPIGIIIVAGGSGNRMGGTLPKQFRMLDGQPLLARTINTFAEALPGVKIIVVLPESHIEFWRNLSARFVVARHAPVTGGAERFDSVRNGLAAMPDDVNLIGVHDGARPLVSKELILRTVFEAELHGAAIPVMEPSDSFRQIEGESSHPIDRSCLRAVQTPQIFRAELLREAYKADFSPAFTDDASVVEQMGATIVLCPGEPRNIKITTPEDLLFAEAILDAEQQADENEPTHGDNL